MLQIATNREHAFLLGALFFSEYLLIHPFANGNGRSARILLNLLLCDITTVPFSLYISDRKQYIDVLEERNDGSPPQALATYVLYCAHSSSARLVSSALE